MPIEDFVARSFPVNDDRAGLLAMIEATVEGDKMDVTRGPSSRSVAQRSTEIRSAITAPRALFFWLPQITANPSSCV
jgi:hypothetical protein